MSVPVLQLSGLRKIESVRSQRSCHLCFYVLEVGRRCLFLRLSAIPNSWLRCKSSPSFRLPYLRRNPNRRELAIGDLVFLPCSYSLTSVCHYRGSSQEGEPNVGVFWDCNASCVCLSHRCLRRLIGLQYRFRCKLGWTSGLCPTARWEYSYLSPVRVQCGMLQG